HHLLLGHGLAIEPIRANVKDAQIGIAYSLPQIVPATDRDADIVAAERADAYINTLFLDPTLKGVYPQAIADLIPPELIQDGDMAIIGSPMEMIGINYYHQLRARADKQPHSLGFSIDPFDPNAPGGLTVMGWEVYPQGLGDWIRRVAHDYPGHDIYITENGAAYPDVLGPDGAVHDERRVTFLRDHTRAALEALAGGAPLKGYFAWSFIDNFEWARGYAPRFGLIYDDYATQARTIKDSGHWYARLIASGSPDEA
ncbi:MAG TPA: family 1 glycosylhydrolase, partial [Ktedonobacterales bacterium]|nr:family 1 glycosylhydrolase [Ktedonobacterales bacterium]